MWNEGKLSKETRTTRSTRKPELSWPETVATVATVFAIGLLVTSARRLPGQTLT